MPWKKGESGNPGGNHTLIRQAIHLARANSRAALERLVELMNSRDERVAILACVAILDRGLGKPAQRLSLSDSDGHDIRELSRVELMALASAPDEEETRDMVVDAELSEPV